MDRPRGRRHRPRWLARRIGPERLVGLVEVGGRALRDGGGDLVRRPAVLEDGHEVTQDLLADQKAALDLAHLGRLDVEVNEEVARLAVPADVVRQAALAPRRDLAEAATAVDDGAGDLLDRRLELVVLQVRPEQEHEFVTTHQVSSTPLYGFATLGAGALERGRKGFCCEHEPRLRDWEARTKYSRSQAAPATQAGAARILAPQSHRPIRDIPMRPKANTILICARAKELRTELEEALADAGHKVTLGRRPRPMRSPRCARTRST